VLLAPMPEEKLHFLQYGLLGGLLFRACSARALRLGGSALGAAVLAIVLAGLAGWCDEGIQAILPNRHYDIRDILWNLLGSSIVILGLLAATSARERDQRS
jgi:VanZ family protein